MGEAVLFRIVISKTDAVYESDDFLLIWMASQATTANVFANRKKVER